MPITPLHCGVLAPVNHWFPGKVSTVSFVLVTAWIDAPQIHAALTGLPLPEHGIQHSLVGAMIAAVIVSVMGIRSMKWVLGAYLAALSHVLLDSLVHPEIEPFWPLEENPLYRGLMEPVSLILLPFMLWFIVQTVSSCAAWIRKRLGVNSARWSDRQAMKSKDSLSNLSTKSTLQARLTEPDGKGSGT